MFAAALRSMRGVVRGLWRVPASAILLLAVLALAGYAVYVRVRRKECMTGDCSEAWATCPVGSPHCYWGDRPYNKGKCCRAPWSTDCKVPVKGSAAAVTLYKDSDYGGSSRTYRVGDYADLGDMADEVSSVKVPSNLKVVLYQKKNYDGKMLTLTGGDYQNLKWFKFSDGTDHGKNYGQNVCGDETNTFCWNDTASSMKVMLA